MNRSRRVRSTITLLTGLALLMTACSTGSSVADSAPPPPPTNEPRTVFVALGADETVSRQLDEPLRDAWTQQLLRSSLPRSAIYVNYARNGATARSAASEQLPEALALEPTIATVWLGSADATLGTSSTSFTQDLTTVVTDLQRAGARVLLITREGQDDRFAESVTAVADATSAALVSVPATDLALPSTHEAIAAAIAEQLQA
jgi:hypothetical protein